MLRNPIDLPAELDLDELLRVDGLQPAEVTALRSKRITVRLPDGVELVWALRRLSVPLGAGDPVWLTPTAT